MSALKFCGFDYTHRNGDAVNGSTLFVNTTFDFALDSGMLLQSFTSDSTSYAPGQAVALTNVGGVGRNSSDGGCLGDVQGTGNATLSAFTGYTQGVTCLRSTLGDPSEIWVTFDIRHSLGANVDNPATYERSESRFQLFKWGDLSLRIRRIFNYATSPTRCDITFELFNVASSLGTITLTSVQANQWMYVRIRALLNASGAFEVSVDGISSNHTGINTVATTPLASATQLWFSSGSLGAISSPSGPYAIGAMDNLYIDNSGFPTGRPTGRRVSISGDNTVSNFAATSSGTITTAAAAVDSNFARGTGVGAYTLFNLGTITTSGLETDLIGWQVQPCYVSNVDVVAAKKVSVGVSLSGTAYMDTAVAAQTPPLAPSYISPGIGSVFFKGGTTPFTLSDIPSIKPRIQIEAV
jgi:hypothetical protein